MKKQVTPITERNGGMHSQKAYRRITAMLDGHGYANPRLYHLVLIDDIETVDAKRFQSALKALCFEMTRLGILHRWRACLERDDAKGLHFHVFILADATLKIPCNIINSRCTGWLRKMLDRKAMKHHLSQPKSDMHRIGGVAKGRRQNYARLTGNKKADCLEWLSYLVKVRSKPDDIKHIYFSSRDKVRTPATKINGADKHLILD